MALVPQEQWDRVYRELTQLLTSRSPLRHLGEGPIDTLAGFILNADGSEHVEIVRLLAGYGHPPTLALLREVASADPNLYPDRQDDAKMAQAILAEVTAPTATVVNNAPVSVGTAAQPQIVYMDRPAPEPAPLPVPIAETNGAVVKTTGQIIGDLYAAVEQLNLADALDIKDRATLAATIKILETKNGASL